jgi:4-hydroxyphenylpyruvate dioxygenase-like putative hemolysin
LAPLVVDHAVIVVRDLDAAAASFGALGFTLTPRGQHSIGSQNHCIMFGSTYLELLAAPKPHPWLAYYREFGEGLAAIALSTDDADAAARELGAKQPMDLSRPVDGDLARFRLVQLHDVPYLFVCQHLTRQLVWRPEWQSHPNGAQELIGAAIPMPRPLDGLPNNIAWGKPAALRIRGNGKSAQAHGVRVEFC